MKTTRISAIGPAPQVVAERLTLLQRHLGWPDTGGAPLLLRKTRHVIRDVLALDAASELAAQVPLLIQGIFFDGGAASRTPARRWLAADFPDRGREPPLHDPLIAPNVAVAMVFAGLHRQISAGGYRQVARALRDPWMR
jgi:uncharacterized protein (DUF2267 family)